MVCPGAAQHALPDSPGRPHVNIPRAALLWLSMPPQAPDSAVAQAYGLTAPQASQVTVSSEALHRPRRIQRCQQMQYAFIPMIIGAKALARALQSPQAG